MPKRRIVVASATLLSAVGLSVVGLSVVGLVRVTPADGAVKAGDRCDSKDVGTTKNGLVCVNEAGRRIWKKASAGPSGTTAKPVAAKSEPVKLGVAVAQSGAAAPLAQDQMNGLMIAERYFNEKGGINGRPLKLVVHDTASEEAGAVKAFTTLINTDGVIGIVGPTLSQQAFAAGPIAETAKVPVIAASSTAPNIPQIGDYIARVSAGVASYAGNAVKFAASLQPTSKAVVFYAHDDSFSRAETLIFQHTARELGIDTLAPQTFKATETDFVDQTAYVVQHRPDMVIISGPASAGNLIRQLRGLGYGGTIVGGNGLNVVQTFSVCKSQCDGLILAQAYSPEIPATGINAEFRKIFKAEFQREPGQIASQAFTAVQVFVEALKVTDKAGKLGGSLAAGRVELNRNILGGSYSTPLGDISFDAAGEVQQKNFYVAQVRMVRAESGDVVSGKFTYVKF